MEPPADTWWAPIETVSNSDGGFERIYQGSGQLFSWPIQPQPGDQLTVRLQQRISTTRDHAAEEASEKAVAAD